MSKQTLTQQYFYLFVNIGALVGQVAMTYAEKVITFPLCMISIFTPRAVRRILASIYTPYYHFLPLSYRSLGRPQPLREIPTDRFRARVGSSCTSVLHERTVEFEPSSDLQKPQAP
jgi:hypothetical protein